MAEKKGFFNFLSRLTGKQAPTFTVEEDAQRTYAKQQEALSQHTEDSRDIPVETKPTAPELSPEVLQFVKEKLSEILTLTGFGGDVTFTLSNEEKLALEITNCQDVGRVIGKDGSTLEALQTLLRAFIFKKFGLNPRVNIDIEEYRKKREDMLKSHAIRAAKMVAVKGKKMDLKPMNPDERRLIHSMFQHDKKIRSYSVGDGVYRHIVLERRYSQNPK